jgi:hypothetical protein
MRGGQSTKSLPKALHHRLKSANVFGPRLRCLHVFGPHRFRCPLRVNLQMVLSGRLYSLALVLKLPAVYFQLVLQLL